MSTRELYEETIDWMKDLLQHTIGSISDAYDATYNYYNSQPLFHISSRELGQHRTNAAIRIIQQVPNKNCG